MPGHGRDQRSAGRGYGPARGAAYGGGGGRRGHTRSGDGAAAWLPGGLAAAPVAMRISPRTEWGLSLAAMGGLNAGHWRSRLTPLPVGSQATAAHGSPDKAAHGSPDKLAQVSND